MNSDVYVRQSGDALQNEVTLPVMINEAQKVLGAGAAPAPERTSKKNDLRQDTEKAEPKMMSKRYWTTTKRGYQLFDVLSAMQKAIRRGDTRMAAYWAAEGVVGGPDPEPGIVLWLFRQRTAPAHDRPARRIAAYAGN